MGAGLWCRILGSPVPPAPSFQGWARLHDIIVINPGAASGEDTALPTRNTSCSSRLCISMKNFFKNPQTSTLMDRKLSGYWPGDACPTLGFSLPSHRASSFTPKPNFFYTLDYDDWLPRSLIPNSEPVTGNRHRSTLMAEDKCKEREAHRKGKNTHRSCRSCYFQGEKALQRQSQRRIRLLRPSAQRCLHPV